MVNKQIDLKHQARRKSIKEGIFSTARTYFGDYYISPFAIAINTSNSIVAMLTSLTGLLGPLSQTLSPKPTRELTRKKIVSRSVFLEALTWIPIIILAILYYKGIMLNLLPIILLISYCLFIILANLSTPAWFSWMGDIVDAKYRGRWFSKRNLITGFISIIIALVSSIFLDYFKKNNLVMFGFITLFILAMISRIISWNILKTQYEPPQKTIERKRESFLKFLKNAPKNNFGKFVLFRSSLAFSAAICSPLLGVYLLRNLNLSYINYMIVIMGGTFVSLFTLELWGKFADKYGNYKTIVISAVCIPILPILWILNKSTIYLVLIPSALEGIVWAGLLLAAGNFIYDHSSTEKRAQSISHYNMMWGIGVFLGASIGAILVEVIKTSLLEPVIIIFIISAVVRVIVVIFWLPKFKEVKKTEKFKLKNAIKYIINKEAKTTIKEEVHQLMTIKKYLKT